ncbi:DUF4362 domain-containing protein [Paenibacillus agaridevorans]|uniref:DUF4362 domain-containing protein n=1 Tax=Paenibacillus agaridevorans TaxID=171404 RepID=UPI000D5911C2|nr:DUF4362 domain-containing protein [Paenibacillus agaridevorans]
MRRRTGTLLGALIVLLTVWAGAAAYMWLKADRHQHAEWNNILHRFNQADIERLNEMVHRHREGKGDYLLLIPPAFDGGYWIHDVHSNGRTITWTIDNTRDGMSSGADKGKQEFICQNIQLRENSERYVYTLEQCAGEDDEILPVFTYRKDSIAENTKKHR